MFSIHISEIQLADGSTVALRKGDVVVVVGPNNAGKTTLLNEVQLLLSGRQASGRIVRDVKYTIEGDKEDLESWLNHTFVKAFKVKSGEATWNRYGQSARRTADYSWGPLTKGEPDELFAAFVTDLDVARRMEAVAAADSIDVLNDLPTHPAHLLYMQEEYELAVADAMREVFGQGIVLDRGAGQKIPIRWGDPPPLRDGEHPVSPSYLVRLRKLPLLSEQGEGVKSFAGTLLGLAASHTFITLLDEPQVFLHPPQARALGEQIARNRREGTQVLLATHSSDFLKGVTSDISLNLRLLRVQREVGGTSLETVDPEAVQRIMRDPILRFTSVLDGLFHDQVVLCESEADCMFYEMVAHSIGNNADVLFVPTGGKSAVAKIATALKQLGVPVSAVVDFDVLNNQNVLRPIVEAFGGSWDVVGPLWSKVDSAVRSVGHKPPTLVSLRDELDQLFKSWNGTVLDRELQKEVRSRTALESGWSSAKKAGVSAVPNGDAQKHLNSLLDELAKVGVFVVPVGELEAWERKGSRKSLAWISDVLQIHDVATLGESIPAVGEFVGRVLDASPGRRAMPRATSSWMPPGFRGSRTFAERLRSAAVSGVRNGLTGTAMLTSAFLVFELFRWVRSLL